MVEADPRSEIWCAQHRWWGGGGGGGGGACGGDRVGVEWVDAAAEAEGDVEGDGEEGEEG